MIHQLLVDLSRQEQKNFEVIITINQPEDESLYQGFSFPLKIIRNSSPKGFGENHNAAFVHSTSDWFVVVNPDIRIKKLDFNDLLLPFQRQVVAAVGPIVLSADGGVEDSARRFPTLLRFVKRVFLRRRGLDYNLKKHPYPVDWIAGMFIVFRREAYQKIGGFDHRRFFMYLEDADICRRLGKMGWQVLVNPNVEVIHMAQRASHRNLKHFRWHVVSALRYLTGL